MNFPESQGRRRYFENLSTDVINILFHNQHDNDDYILQFTVKTLQGIMKASY